MSHKQVDVTFKDDAVTTLERVKAIARCDDIGQTILVALDVLEWLATKQAAGMKVYAELGNTRYEITLNSVKAIKK